MTYRNAFLSPSLFRYARRPQGAQRVRGIFDDGPLQTDAAWTAVHARIVEADHRFKSVYGAGLANEGSPKFARAKALITPWDSDAGEALAEHASWVGLSPVEKLASAEAMMTLAKQRDAMVTDYESAFASLLTETDATHSPDWSRTRDVQLELVAEGYDIGPTGADDVNGPGMSAAIQAFRTKHGLREAFVVDDDVKAALTTEHGARVKREGSVPSAFADGGTTEGYASVDDVCRYGKRVNNDVEDIVLKSGKWYTSVYKGTYPYNTASPEQTKAYAEFGTFRSEWGQFSADHGNWEPGAWGLLGWKPDSDTFKEVARYDLLAQGHRKNLESLGMLKPLDVAPPDPKKIDELTEKENPPGAAESLFGTIKTVAVAGAIVAGVVLAVQAFGAVKSVLPSAPKEATT